MSQLWYDARRQEEDHRKMHEGQGCQHGPDSYCGDVLALVDTGCDWSGSVCLRCMECDPHEHRT